MFRTVSSSLFCNASTYKKACCTCIPKQSIWNFSRNCSSSQSKNETTHLKQESEELNDSNLHTHLGLKFKKFRDEESEVIFDVLEEQKRIHLSDLNIEEKALDPYEGLNMTRGINGVFEIEDLVEILKRDNAKKVFVATVPKEYTYVDYIVLATAKSPRHMLALANFIRKAYKIKRHKQDKLPKIEGATSNEWLAMDMGNIALHIFTNEARNTYDLETLWAVGSQYDDLTNDKDANQEIIEKYSDFLREFQPAE